MVVGHSNAEEPMLAPACAVEDVNVRHHLVGVALEALDLVILGMPAAGSDLLVLLQMVDVLLLQVPIGERRHLDARAGLNRGKRPRLALREIGEYPARFRLREFNPGNRERVRLHQVVLVNVNHVAPKSSVNVSPLPTANVEP